MAISLTYDMDNLIQQWAEMLETPGVSWIVFAALLVVMVLVAIFVVGFFRKLATGEFGTGREEDFDVIREIHGRGMIADEEYERAKALLSEQTDVDALLNVKQVDSEKK